MPPHRNASRKSRSSSAPDASPKKRKPGAQPIPPVVKPEGSEILKAIRKKVNIPITVESGYMSQALEDSDWLVKSEEILRSDPPDTYGRYKLFSESSTKDGRELCAPHESDLARLEKIIQPELTRMTAPRTKEEKEAHAAKIDAALSEYRQLVMKIITQSASQPSPDEAMSSFSIRDSPVSRVNTCLWIAPWKSSAVSKTIVSEPDDTPALVWLQDDKPLSGSLRTDLMPKPLLESLAFELSSQMPQRFTKGAKSHQGIAFDGLVASLLVLRWEKPSDILKNHQTAFARTEYPVALCRPAFVSKMTQLLRGHLDYRQAFKHSDGFRAYNARKGQLDDVAPIRMPFVMG